MKCLRRIFAFSFFYLISSFGYAEPPLIQSTSEQVTFLELYSSEGSAACPPADQWIAQFQNHPDLWRKFVPIVFHVTYWDRLGWKDRFASPEFDDRHKAFVESWKALSITTPTFVLNGVSWENWFETKEIPAAPAKQIGVLSAKALDTEEYLVSFKPLIPVSKPLEIHGALLGFAVPSQVTEGENLGKHLVHQFIVLNYRNKDFSAGENNFTTSLLFSLARKSEAARLAAVFWVTEKGNPVPLQAAGGFIS